MKKQSSRGNGAAAMVRLQCSVICAHRVATQSTIKKSTNCHKNRSILTFLNILHCQPRYRNPSQIVPHIKNKVAAPRCPCLATPSGNFTRQEISQPATITLTLWPISGVDLIPKFEFKSRPIRSVCVRGYYAKRTDPT